MPDSRSHGKEIDKMVKEFTIENKSVGIDTPTYIVAEMSGNHLQNLDKAKEIVSAAKRAGADAVKIQTYRPDTITIDCRGKEFMATPGSPWEGMNLYELYQTSYTPWEWHEEIMKHAKNEGITCFSTPFDLTAVDFLEKLNVPAYKIASFEINDIPLIEKVAQTGKPIIISTGVATLEDIILAKETCEKNGNNKLALLKCVSEYPPNYEDLNLRTISDMKERFSCIVGLSDHSLGDSVAISGVTLGARIVEKHLTINRAEGGPDASFSMEPLEFENMVKNIRNIENALGRVTYELTDRQKESRKRSRSLYVVKDIKQGELFTEDNLKSIRPGFGIHTKYLKEILGKKACCDLKKGTAMNWEYVEKGNK
jgi:pseudaminic acid synthase